MKEKEQALRHNHGKLQWSLVDFESLEPLVEVLEFGAEKYAPNNWKKGLPITKTMESLLRHAFAYLSGEDNDPESGASHIGHIMCNAMFITHMTENKPEFDDRLIKDQPKVDDSEDALLSRNEQQRVGRLDRTITPPDIILVNHNLEFTKEYCKKFGYKFIIDGVEPTKHTTPYNIVFINGEIPENPHLLIHDDSLKTIYNYQNPFQ